MTDRQRVADAWEIVQLANLYCQHADAGRIDELSELFTPNGIWDGTGVLLGKHEGREEIANFMKGLGIGAVVGSCHLSSNHVVNFDSVDHAVGSVYTTSETRLRNGSVRLAFNIVHDEYVWTGEQWRFSSRRIEFLIPARMIPDDAPLLTEADSKRD